MLGYTRHQSPQIRQQVALALGQLAASCPLRSETERIISTLGSLSQDSSPLVREAAMTALGSIQSDQVLPYLQRGLNDAVSDVKKAASLALQHARHSQSPSSKPRSLWENRPGSGGMGE
ncbi:HEAT repeat domain-containing protein [Roseofilum capinflatum]|uniref:HEAT repeat domain-containing protein n=1 Tax=Roseofilum capinflatum BLCC-M114 TaxID=3022440 RepID=A0ABT7BBH4_9CYAN|nr:HEAT repeat domain-containing protein [Roseofilum capinflatum]MDJ1175866.1 HEAT repeat domain-containing protein [Roseofilum capinflatum BLCC-M114]